MVHIGLQKGWSFAFVAHMVRTGKLRIIIVFAESERYEPPTALLEIEEERLTIWSSIPDFALSPAISKALFEVPIFTGIEDNWNSLVTFIGSVSQSLYPNSVRNGVFGISARYDLKRIGVPFPANLDPRPGDQRVENMLWEASGPRVPFLTFGAAELVQLINVSTAHATGIVANWLFREWGKPSLIKANKT